MARPRTVLDPALVAALAGQGLPDQVIADRVGCSRHTVLRTRHAHAIPAARPVPDPDAPRRAHARYAARMAAQTRRAPAWGAPWRPADDTQLLALPDHQAAELLGRTWSACRARRQALTHTRRRSHTTGVLPHGPSPEPTQDRRR